MDQLNAFFVMVKTHRFWISCGLVFLLAVGFGAYGYAKQGAEIQKNDKSIKAANQQADAVIKAKADLPMVEASEDGETTEDTSDKVFPLIHPNQKTVSGMKKNIQAGQKEIVTVWKSEFTQQQQFLKWPDNIFKQAADFSGAPSTGAKLKKNVTLLAHHFPGHEQFDISEDTKKYVKKNPSADQLAGMSQSERDLYEKYNISERQRKLVQLYIPYWLPNIARMADAQWDLPIETYKETAAQKIEQMFSSKKKLAWRNQNQKYWLDRCTKFGNSGNDTGTAIVSQLVYVQEDMAVLSNVMNAIGQTNKKHHQAIRVLREVLTGRDAYDAKAFSFAGDNFTVYGKNQGDETAQLQSIGGAKGGGATESEDDSVRLDPSNQRYVNRKFKKIKANLFRDNVKGRGEASTEGEKVSRDTWQIVFRRLPVRVRVLIDERHIDEFLTQCANAKMPINVRQFAMLPGNHELHQVKADENGGGGGGGDGGGKGAGGGGMADFDGGGSADSSGKGSLSVGEINADLNEHPELNSHFYVPLEIYGTVRLYNRPNESLFNASSADNAENN